MGYRRPRTFQESHSQLPQRRTHGFGSFRPRKYAPPDPDMPSAESIPKWIDFIREAGKKDIKVYVIGNKSDL